MDQEDLVIDKFKKNKAVEIVKKDHFFSRIHVGIATAIIFEYKKQNSWGNF